MLCIYGNCVVYVTYVTYVKCVYIYNISFYFLFFVFVTIINVDQIMHDYGNEHEYACNCNEYETMYLFVC